MVYCGKPSKGCSNCRERKIRCDQREPGCGQCEKRQQQCPGYRNLVDLMFRDESSHVIQKAHSKSRKRIRQSPDKSTPSSTGPFPTPSNLTWSPTESNSSSPNTKRPSKKALPRRPSPQRISPQQRHPFKPHENANATYSALLKQEPESSSGEVGHLTPLSYNFSPSYQERGLNFFVARYVTVSENSCHLRYDFVFDLWKPSIAASERARDPVLASITAVGLAGVAELTQTRLPLDAARKSYGQALSLTNAALHNPGEAVKDTTMLSVLILGLFETMTEPGCRNLHAWQQHINGAAALARMRGMGQFRSKAGIRLFMMLCQNTMISCIQNELPMPRELIDMRTQLCSMFKGTEPGFEICNPIYKILQLKYDIKQGNVTDLDEMLDKFTEAEDDFERVVSIFPEAWQYRRFRLTQRPRPGFFSNVCHGYPSLRVATIWNGLRTCRMLILETMIEELHKHFLRVPVDQVPGRYQAEYQKARFKMERIALAILASVPQHFGLVSPTDVEGGLDTPALVPSAEDYWPQIPESEGPELLGDSDGSDSSSSDDGEHCCRSPSLSNPMLARGPDVRAERFMILASVQNGLVWPLYLVGMSTATSALMRTYVIQRLHAIHAETGLIQARTLADVVASHGQSTEMSGQRTKTYGSMDFKTWSGAYIKEDQQPLALPV